jgi:ORF6N domain
MSFWTTMSKMRNRWDSTSTDNAALASCGRSRPRNYPAMGKTTQTLRSIDRSILTIRGHRVLLDDDLARLYEVETKALNRAVKRNLFRFPADFMFRLSAEEYVSALRCQIGTSKGRGGRR